MLFFSLCLFFYQVFPFFSVPAAAREDYKVKDKARTMQKGKQMAHGITNEVVAITWEGKAKKWFINWSYNTHILTEEIVNPRAIVYSWLFIGKHICKMSNVITKVTAKRGTKRTVLCSFDCNFSSVPYGSSISLWQSKMGVLKVEKAPTRQHKLRSGVESS